MAFSNYHDFKTYYQNTFDRFPYLDCGLFLISGRYDCLAYNGFFIYRILIFSLVIMVKNRFQNQNNSASGASQATGQGQAPGSVSPGRVVKEEQPVHLPDGSKRVFRRVQVTVKDQNGIYRTESTTELTPPLDCGCQPDGPNDIYQCYLDFSVVDGDHIFTCPLCGRLACTGCAEGLEMENSNGVMETVQVCAECEWKENHPVFEFLENLFFGV
ncbi:hypothetical protein AKJ51_00710 [candidate division MSBL1 archaeon SCGC-AAA382A20]|uniref:Uncharacterized protein n=1 Tax=candidate division MSBL1 archaeon SCGC-AAA382A20 TaxID=1698280 RepID=A0A133VME8_9EURY|nr:hypothetical protein AKJ51_00710 [candidate division MSBL1 archaeon SCGC-AAA382A20]